MLVNLHVKNLALIEEADINFEEGLNILTGETGAGKSIILGSINIALGGKVPADIIRKGAEYARTELVFHIEDKTQLEALEKIGVEDISDGDIIISRKVTSGRSPVKVNGMSCTASQVRQIAALLIDIHGQHDSQMLLHEGRHLEMVDIYGAEKILPVKEEFAAAYREYARLTDELERMDMDEEGRNREISFMEFEADEIESASLKAGEDEELERRFKRMSNVQKIMGEIAVAHQLLSDGEDSIRDRLGSVVRAVCTAASFDDSLEEIAGLLGDAEGILSDAGRQMADYVQDSSFDEADFAAVQERLDLINSLKMKYGKTIGDIIAYGASRREKLEELYDYDARLQRLCASAEKQEKKLDEIAERLSELRKEAARSLCEKVSAGLKELNFLNDEFSAVFEKTKRYTANGGDSMRFMISTNVGEPLKPLSKVASGGELSRIMLALKTVIAGQDEMDTFIFDEIDAGISGRTAQQVAEKLNRIAHSHQIICITHLPQIAAMADTHYRIEKTAQDNSTATTIKKLSESESVEELARLLGGSSITKAAVSNAAELKQLAAAAKQSAMFQ